MGIMENYTSMENQQNIFFWTFSSFCFHFIGSNVLVCVAQNSVSDKSYGCDTSIRFIRNTNLINKHQYIASNKVKTKGRKSSEKNILLLFHTCVVLYFSHFCHLMTEFCTEHGEIVL